MGIGPAIIKTVVYKYKAQEFDSLFRFYQSCCDPQASAYFKKLEETPTSTLMKQGDLYLTSPLKNNIIPGQDKRRFMLLKKSELNTPFWEKLNTERNELTLKVCYCSLLGECYVTEKNGIVEEIEYCPVKLPKSTLL